MAVVSQKKTLRLWFQRFRSRNFGLQNELHARPQSKVDNEELKAIMAANKWRNTSESHADCGVSVQRIY